MSERHLSDYVKLCLHHLQKPVQKTISEEGRDGVGWINLALTGMSALESDVVIRQSALVQLLTNCWSVILKWTKAIFHGHHFYGAYELFFSNMTGIVNLFRIVASPLLENGEVFDFVVDLWKGVEAPGGIEYYTEEALFTCLLTSSSWQIDRIQARSGFTCTEMVKKTVNRMQTAVASEPKGTEKIFNSVSFLGKLANFTAHPIVTAILSRELKVAATILSNIKRLLDDKNVSSGYLTAIRWSFGFLNGYIKGKPDNAMELMAHDLLYNLFRAASTDPSQDLEDTSRYITCLQFLLPSLAHERALLSLMDVTRELFSGRSLMKMLRTTHERFQRAWKIFEAAFVEQLLLHELFEKGYTRERGACANVSIGVPCVICFLRVTIAFLAIALLLQTGE